MHLLVVFMYYLRPGDPGIKRTNEYCQLWASEAGVRVTVLTGQLHYNTGKVYPDLQGQHVVREEDGPVNVYRIAAPNTFRKGYKGRGWSQLGWALNAARVLREIDRPDFVLGVSPPLWAAYPVLQAKRRWRIPAILELRDIWPEAIVKMGIAPWYHPAVLAMRGLERWAYHGSDHLVPIAETMKLNVVLRGLKAEKDITVIPHGVLLDPYEQLAPGTRERMRPQLGLTPEQKLVIYAGSHGPAYGLTTLIDVAEALRDRPEIQFLTIGEGWERQKLTEDAQQRGLTNIRLLGPVPTSEVPSYLAAADIAVSLVSPKALAGWNQRTTGGFRNILCDYAAARLPVVFNNLGDAILEVQDRAQGGLYASTDRGIGEFVRHLLYLVDHPDDARRMGENNYRGIAVRYNRRKTSEDYLNLMRNLMGGVAIPQPSAPPVPPGGK